MRILVIEPNRRPRPAEIDGSLESMQALVGGLIQPVYPYDDPVALVCNEEGKITGLPANRALKDDGGQIYDIVAGTFFICGFSPSGDDFGDLSPELADKYSGIFRSPEVFLDINGQVVVLPVEPEDGTDGGDTARKAAAP